MARRLRYAPPRSVVEVTTRTIQGRFLLRPSPALNTLILGIIGRAQAKYDIEIYAFAFLSNHFHMLLSPPSAKALSEFMNFIDGNIAKEAGRLHDWSDKFWARRYQSIVVADEAAQQDRLRYILAHGCKEDLVARVTDWPGVHCASALMTGAPLRGIWIDRTAHDKARRRNEHVDQSDFCTEYQVKLSPLPCWSSMEPAAYRHACAGLVADIEREAAQRNAARSRRPLGHNAILRQHPHDRPQRSKRSPTPLVHAGLRKSRDAFLAAHRWFVDLYRAAAERLRMGQRDVVFPPGAFPPPAPFVISAPRPVAAAPSSA
jgi:REP element-mobilizing transposase RayT